MALTGPVNGSSGEVSWYDSKHHLNAMQCNAMQCHPTPQECNARLQCNKLVQYYKVQILFTLPFIWYCGLHLVSIALGIAVE